MNPKNLGILLVLVAILVVVAVVIRQRASAPPEPTRLGRLHNRDDAIALEAVGQRAEVSLPAGDKVAAGAARRQAEHRAVGQKVLQVQRRRAVGGIHVQLPSVAVPSCSCASNCTLYRLRARRSATFAGERGIKRTRWLSIGCT
jgi:hypothetical protein